MITVTPDAAKQIKVSMEESKIEDLPLRIAIKQLENGNFHYAMGFDDQTEEGDSTISTEGVDIVLDGHTQALAKGMMLDFVELEGKMEFIFLNPNDPQYRPPQD
jgi:iron-sulfur cluster assembly accessory protein